MINIYYICNVWDILIRSITISVCDIVISIHVKIVLNIETDHNFTSNFLLKWPSPSCSFFCCVWRLTDAMDVVIKQSEIVSLFKLKIHEKKTLPSIISRTFYILLSSSKLISVVDKVWVIFFSINRFDFSAKLCIRICNVLSSN